jgi:hypothetical protein
MNSQRGKASTQASKTKRQANKSQTNVRKNRKPRINLGIRDLNFSASMNERSSVAAAYSQGVSSQSARVTRSSINSTRIVHREQLDTISGSINFNIDGTWNINPGLSTTFPWLSLQARGWEKYKFNNLSFHYYPRCSTSTSGSVMLSPDYDSSDIPPTSEQTASNNLGAVEDAPWKSLCLRFQADLLNSIRYIRFANLPTTLDIRLSDVAQLNVITSNGTDTSAWGKLWVEYDVTLMVPTTNNSVDVGRAIGSYTLNNFYGNHTFIDRGITVTTVQPGTLIVDGLIVGNGYQFVTSLSGTNITLFSPTSHVGFTQTIVPSNHISGGLAASYIAIYVATAASATILMGITSSTVTGSYVSIANLYYSNF